MQDVDETWMDKLLSQGEKKGREEGRQAGREEGRDEGLRIGVIEGKRRYGCPEIFNTDQGSRRHSWC